MTRPKDAQPERGFEGKVLGENSELVWKDQRFGGTDGILFFDFLQSLMREAGLAIMSEAQIFLVLPRRLKKSPA